MTRSLYKPNVPNRVSAVKADLGKMRRARPTGQWQLPRLVADPADPNTQINPNYLVLKNNFVQPAAPNLAHQFRWHMDGSLQFRGHVKFGTGSSGAVAYTLPGAVEGEPDWRPDADTSYVDYALTSGGVYVLARYQINATTGDVTVTQVNLGGNPYGSAGWSNIVAPYSVPNNTVVTLDTIFDSNPSKGTYIYDEAAYDIFPTTPGARGRVYPADTSAVYVVTVGCSFATEFTTADIGIGWPGVQWGSFGATHKSIEPQSVYQMTEHRLVVSEGGFFTTSVSQNSGIARDLNSIQVEITRLVDEATVSGLTNTTAS